MYQKEFKEILETFKSNEKTGLSHSATESLIAEHGLNELQGKKKVSILVKYLLQFKDPLIIILVIAALVSGVIGHEWIESIIIFGVIIVNAALGVFQEDKAEKSLEALEKMSMPLCKVLRDGQIEQIETKFLVPGDIIIIEAGDFIPADARLIEASNLHVDESALTGESVPVTKTEATIHSEGLPLGDQKNLIFSSTYVTNGRGKAVVFATGMNTQIGKIAGMLIDEKQSSTPLQEKLSQVGKMIGIMALAVCFVVFILEIITAQPVDGQNVVLDSFKTAVALAVAAIPEGLATVVTIVLAIGVSNMSNRKAIVKKLPAVETLGSTSVVCSDKTGTLTQNKMTVLEVYSTNLVKIADASDADKQLISYFATCSDASITVIDGVEKRIGDPTETALIEVNNKHGHDISLVSRLFDLPFDSTRKMMSVVIKEGSKYLAITKGAPDIILGNCVNDQDELQRALAANNNMADRALRVLGLAIKEFTSLPREDELENGMTFLGLVGMIDPARPEVKDAIALAKKAGIRTVMITGDHINTAKAIALELGILEEGHLAITANELHQMTDEELRANVTHIAVYARVAPEDKVRIVDAWQAEGHVVAMTGDGVNDSPALKRADIGCAMGITGTDVSKEAADMILVDDNFATIIAAVSEGRGIYENVQKCIKYLLSSNIGEVFTIFVASLMALFGWQLGIPLLPIHLLWINLITDSLPAFGLGMEKADPEVMNNPPRSKKEGFFANHLGSHIVIEGVIIGCITLIAYIIGHESFQDGDAVGRTMAFMTLSSCQLFHAYNVKTTHSLFSRKTFKNRFLNWAFIIGFVLQFGVLYIPYINSTIFGLVPLEFGYLAITLGLAFSVIVMMEIAKRFGYRR